MWVSDSSTRSGSARGSISYVPKDAAARWWERFDVDTFLAYETPKVVIIKDRWLGFLTLLSYFCVTGYFLAIPIMGNSEYLKLEPVQGWVEVSLQDPDALADAGDLSYCEQYAEQDSDFDRAPRRRECFRLASEYVMHGSSADVLFLATRLRHETHNLSCLQRSPARDSDGPGVCLQEAQDAYVLQPERYRVRIGHGVSLDGAGVRRAGDMIGSLRCPGCGQRSGLEREGSSDVILVSDMLLAAGVSLDGAESVRNSGVVLLLAIHYQHDWLGNPYSYEYRVTPAAFDAHVRDASLERHARDDGAAMDEHSMLRIEARSGLRVFLYQSGLYGHVTLYSFLVACVASAGLLRFAKKVVDLILSQVMPLREIYRMLKWEESVDFSDLKAGKPQAVEAMRQFCERAERNAARGGIMPTCGGLFSSEFTPVVDLVGSTAPGGSGLKAGRDPGVVARFLAPLEAGCEPLEGQERLRGQQLVQPTSLDPSFHAQLTSLEARVAELQHRVTQALEAQSRTQPSDAATSRAQLQDHASRLSLLEAARQSEIAEPPLRRLENLRAEVRGGLEELRAHVNSRLESLGAGPASSSTQPSLTLHEAAPLDASHASALQLVTEFRQRLKHGPAEHPPSQPPAEAAGPALACCERGERGERDCGPYPNVLGRVPR